MRILYDSNKLISLDDCLVYITVDPGGGASVQTATLRSDKCGFAVVAVPVSGQWFVLDCFQEYLDDKQLVNKLFELNEKWMPYLIGIEKMPHLDQFIREQFLHRNKTLSIHWLEPKGRKKEARIRGL